MLFLKTATTVNTKRLFGSQPQLATPKMRQPFSLLTDPTEEELPAAIDLLFSPPSPLSHHLLFISYIARRLLSKPIKFYYEMQELFTGTSADGSLAMDQHTCTIDSDDSDNDEGLYDLNCYPQYEGPLEEDSDTLPTTYGPKRPPVHVVLAAPAPQMPQVIDPYASLWHRLEVLPITMDQNITVGMHLSSKENEGLCGWLCCASDKTFETWVWKFFDKDEV
ncbi:hypothetical protein VPH35_080554 [Triticum aestivum]